MLGFLWLTQESLHSYECLRHKDGRESLWLVLCTASLLRIPEQKPHRPKKATGCPFKLYVLLFHLTYRRVTQNGTSICLACQLLHCPAHRLLCEQQPASPWVFALSSFRPHCPTLCNRLGIVGWPVIGISCCSD